MSVKSKFKQMRFESSAEQRMRVNESINFHNHKSYTTRFHLHIWPRLSSCSIAVVYHVTKMRTTGYYLHTFPWWACTIMFTGQRMMSVMTAMMTIVTWPT